MKSGGIKAGKMLLELASKVDKLYWSIFGMNGDPGLLERERKLTDKVDAMHRRLDDSSIKLDSILKASNDRRFRADKIVGWILQAAAWAALLTHLAGLW